MDDNTLEGGTASPFAEETTSTTEIVGIPEELFTSRMDSLENVLFGNFVFLGVLVGVTIVGMVMRWFHVR